MGTELQLALGGPGISVRRGQLVGIGRWGVACGTGADPIPGRRRSPIFQWCVSNGPFDLAPSWRGGVPTEGRIWCWRVRVGAATRLGPEIRAGRVSNEVSGDD